MAGCPGPLSWSWEPQGDLAGDARRKKGDGLFISLAPFLGGCHMVAPSLHKLTALVR